MSENAPIRRKIVKKGGHGGHHGGAWKVAYADFVTAMMAFFLLMWLLAALNPDQKEGLATYFQEYGLFESGTGLLPKTDSSKPSIGILSSKAAAVDAAESKEKSPKPPEAIEGEETDPEEPAEHPSEVGKAAPKSAAEKAAENAAQKAAEAEKAHLEEFKSELMKTIQVKLKDMNDQVLVDFFEGSVRIQVVDRQDRPMFALGNSNMTETARKAVEVLAGSLNEISNKVAIEGHTDSLSYASDRYTNWELSTDRAAAARRAFEAQGLSPDRIFRVAGYAASAPLIKDKPQDPRNRRISILVLPNVTMPGNTNGLVRP